MKIDDDKSIHCKFSLNRGLRSERFTLNCIVIRKILRILAISLPCSPLDPFMMLKLYC